MELKRLAKQLGLETCLEFDPRELAPEERIRAFCRANKCGSYAANYMCPPQVGSVEEIAARLKPFRSALLLQYSQNMDVQTDREGVMLTQREFHRKVLQLEEFLKEHEVRPIWALVGGNCQICEVCAIQTAEPCRHPEQARMSLEAIGVDVFGLLDRLGLESGFRPDKITWTGCVLMGEKEL